MPARVISSKPWYRLSAFFILVAAACFAAAMDDFADYDENSSFDERPIFWGPNRKRAPNVLPSTQDFDSSSDRSASSESAKVAASFLVLDRECISGEACAFFNRRYEVTRVCRCASASKCEKVSYYYQCKPREKVYNDDDLSAISGGKAKGVRRHTKMMLLPYRKYGVVSFA